ncbi:MAG: hypothetical protein COA58_16870 [Bacteroidetes bacterium]|nr:MAG: hypothetical protein COA58_16870 [Bacteroidota bacterium]
MLILSFSITETKKEEIENYAIEYAIKQYRFEKSKLQQNDLVTTGLEFLGKYEPKLADKLNVADSIINQTLATVKLGKLEYFDELKDLNANDRKKVLTINNLEGLTNTKFIKRYITMKYIIALEEIPKEVRIFLICNILLFIVIMITTKLRNLADRVIVFPLILLFIATITSMYVFFFETNWLFKIVSNSYSGYGYLAMVLILFILLNIFTLENRIINSTMSKENK